MGKQYAGLTDMEIGDLQKDLNLTFPETYVFYLENITKESIGFEIETDIEQLKKINKELRSELDKLDLWKNKDVLCVKKETEYIKYFESNLDKFYFFDLSEKNEFPSIYYTEEVCINEGWNAFRTEVRKYKGENSLNTDKETDKDYESILVKGVSSILKLIFK